MEITRRLLMKAVHIQKDGLGLTLEIEGNEGREEKLTMFLDNEMIRYHNILHPKGERALLNSVLEAKFIWTPPVTSPRVHSAPNEIIWEEIVTIETWRPSLSDKPEHYLIIRSQEEFHSCFGSDPASPYFTLKIPLTSEEYNDCRNTIRESVMGTIHLAFCQL